MAQLCALQVRTSTKVLHGDPPNMFMAVMWRLRACVPVPQSREHALHSDHSDTWQGTGHGDVLQSDVCTRAGQSVPLPAITVRCRACLPEPHDLVQADHGEKPETLHVRSQPPLKHACCSYEAPHCMPPKFGT